MGLRVQPWMPVVTSTRVGRFVGTGVAARDKLRMPAINTPNPRAITKPPAIKYTRPIARISKGKGSSRSRTRPSKTPPRKIRGGRAMTPAVAVSIACCPVGSISIASPRNWLRPARLHDHPVAEAVGALNGIQAGARDLICQLRQGETTNRIRWPAARPRRGERLKVVKPAAGTDATHQIREGRAQPCETIAERASAQLHDRHQNAADNDDACRLHCHTCTLGETPWHTFDACLREQLAQLRHSALQLQRVRFQEGDATEFRVAERDERRKLARAAAGVQQVIADIERR